MPDFPQYHRFNRFYLPILIVFSFSAPFVYRYYDPTVGILILIACLIYPTLQSLQNRSLLMKWYANLEGRLTPNNALLRTKKEPERYRVKVRYLYNKNALGGLVLDYFQIAATLEDMEEQKVYALKYTFTPTFWYFINWCKDNDVQLVEHRENQMNS